MPKSRSSVATVVAEVRRTVSLGVESSPSDGRLLTSFVADGDPEAFALLVRRHGPMVLSVCRRITGHAHDAEDAFQAAFIVLARRAAAVKPREAVGNWLYGVAVRTAREARSVSARRRARETPVAAAPDRTAEPTEPSDADDLRVLDEEVAALPDHLRTPVVLCDLGGECQAALARRLGVPVGTVYSRLAAARSLLAKRLRKRGVALSAAALAGLGKASAAVPPQLIDAAVALATASAPLPAAVFSLSNGVLRTMLLHKLKLAPVVLVIVASGVLARGLLPEAEPPAAPKPPAPTEKSKGADEKADAATPLKEAVEAFNEREIERLRAAVREGKLPEERLPASLTVEEVVAAIRNWDKKKQPVADATYAIYKRIADTQTLPPKAALSHTSWWERSAKNDGFEDYTWRIDLCVITGKDPKSGGDLGYGFAVRDVHRLWRRASPAMGYEWLEGPSKVTVPGGWYASRVVMVEANGRGGLVVTAAWPRDDGNRPGRGRLHDVRVVAIDAEGNRHVLDRDRRWGGTTPDFTLHRYRLDPAKLPAKDVHQVGIEALDDAGLRQVSEAAVKRAKEKGIGVLPLPEVGRPYEFTLTAADGKVVDSRKLRGKVVLVDCWASWCGQCLKNMPELKKLYEAWHDKGLEVVGVSLDQDSDKAAAAVKRLELPWPSVVAAGDEEAQRLWTEAARISSMPRYLVIDRKGILRADTNSTEELAKAITDLLTDSRKQP